MGKFEYIFEIGNTKFLVDCGLFYPKDEGLDIEAGREKAIQGRSIALHIY